MLRTRDDIKRHANDILGKARSEIDKKTRCYFIAQLYSKVNEYQLCIDYLLEYLSVKNNSAPAHKLLAVSYEGLNRVDDALNSYEKSYELDSTQTDVLLKMCDLFNNDNITFNKDKVKNILDLIPSCFQQNVSVFNVKEKLLNNGNENDKNEYEKLLNNEIKTKPSDLLLKIKLLKLFIDTNRVEIAYKNMLDIENQSIYKRNLQWYDIFDTICEKYYEKNKNKCDFNFYVYWLNAVDSICSLSYSDNVKSSNDCYQSLLKFDKLLLNFNNCMGSNDNFKDTNDHYSSQLAFHLGLLLIKKTKEECDYLPEIKKNQIWSDRNIKIGALLLLSIKNKIHSISPLKSNRDKLYEFRYHQSVTRFIETYFTLLSLSKNNNQGEKQFITNVTFCMQGKWREDIYSMFKSNNVSHFLKSNYFTTIPQKFPSSNSITPSLFNSFEIVYCGNLHNMIWLGLRTIVNENDLKINPNLRSITFKSLETSCGNLSSCGVETLNQLDLDSFLYLNIFCRYVQLKKDHQQHIVLPSLVTNILCNEKEECFWNEIIHLSKLSKQDWFVSKDSTQMSRIEIQNIVEIVRGNKLQLPLIVHLARTFKYRSEIENGLIRDACEERAKYLYDLVLINIQDNNELNSSFNNKKNSFFTFNVPNFSHSEKNAIKMEARTYIGSYYIKSESYDKAIDILKSVKTPESLYKQAIAYEKIPLKDISLLRDEFPPESRSKRSSLSNKSRDCLLQALDMLKSSGDDGSMMNKVTNKLSEIDNLNGVKYENDDDNVHYSSEGSTSLNISDSEEIQMNQPLNSSNRILFSNHTSNPLQSSTPSRRRHQERQDYRTNSNISSNAVDIAEMLNLHHNTDQMKLQCVLARIKLVSDQIEVVSSEQKSIKTLVEELTNRMIKFETDMKLNFTELKKEMKQKPDLCNMLDEEEYNAEDVLNYQNISNYFPRGGNVPGIANSAVNYPTPTPIPAGAYFPPNSLYQGNLPFYCQSPFGENPQMAEYFRTLATSQQRGNSLTNLPAGLPLHTQIGNTPNLSHLQQMAVTSSPTTKPSVSQQVNQPQAPNNVVITTSDALPTSVPSNPPTLFVNIPPEHRLGSTPTTIAVPPQPVTVAAPHKFQIPMPSNFKLVEKAPVPDPADDKDIEATLDALKDSESGMTIPEYDPLPNFEPIIPLPDEVEVKTGEENETVIFDCRAKLFRLVDKEWKERGIGQLKILKFIDDKPRFRIIMRRDQVHKVCANHFITEDMKLVKTQNNDKSYIWWAHDFADTKMEVEKFLVRFKTVENGELFKNKFDEARKAMEGMSPVKSSAKIPEQNRSYISTPKLGTANAVLAPPKLGPVSTEILSTPKEKAVSSFSFSSNDKVNVGGFTFSSQPKLADVSKEKGPEKETPDKTNSGLFSSFSFGAVKVEENKSTGFTFAQKSDGKLEHQKEEVKCDGNSSKLMDLFKPEVGQWECRDCYLQNPSHASECVACKAPNPNSKINEKVQPSKPSVDAKKSNQSDLPSLASMFKPPQGSWACDVCLVQNKPDKTECIACGTLKPGCSPSQKSTPAAPTFSFGIPTTQTVSISVPVVSSTKNSFDSPASDVKSTPVAFGGPPQTSSSTSIFKFGTPSSSSNFTFGSANFSFTMTTPVKNVDDKSPHTTPKSAQKSDADDSENEHDDEDKDLTEGIYFQPVVDLPDKIDVKTGEEDEIVLYSHRSKLFRYVAEVKEWKERGIGDVKILKHSSTNKIRLLMRREPVMKLCLNHYVTPEIEMKAKDPKSWMWCAADYSEGEQRLEKFCIRFKTPDIASEFKENFDRIKNDPNAATSGDDDVIFVSETPIVSDELREKAMALKLPENFYKYLDLPDCKGCRGCKHDPNDDDKAPVADNSMSKPFFGQGLSFGMSSQQSPLFGSKPFFGTPPVSTSNIFGAGSVTPTTSNSGSFLFSQSTSNQQTENLPATPQNTPDTTKSQLSTFTFSIPQPSTSSTFAFSSQHPVFGNASVNTFGGQVVPNNPSIFAGGENTDVLKGTAQNTPIFGGMMAQNNAFSGGNNNSTPVFGSPSWSAGTTFYSTSSSFNKPDQTQSASPMFGAAATTALATPENLKMNEKPQEVPSEGLPPATNTVKDDSKSANNILFRNLFSSPADTQTKMNDTSSPVAPVSSTATPTAAPEVKKDLLSFMSGAEGLTFGALQNSSANNSFAGDNSSFKWEGAGQTIFGMKKSGGTTPVKSNDKEADEDDNNVEGGGEQENEEHDPYFEPIVPLPNKIELKTGEEDEDIIFSERGKLYRHDPNAKEWKERGVGLIKILNHRGQKTYRVLMRREQVHKIVCNHLITPDIHIYPMKMSETSYCWAAMNLSQDDPEPFSELLCIKFKNKDLALQFRNCFVSAQEKLQLESPSK